MTSRPHPGSRLWDDQVLYPIFREAKKARAAQDGDEVCRLYGEFCRASVGAPPNPGTFCHWLDEELANPATRPRRGDKYLV